MGLKYTIDNNLRRITLEFDKTCVLEDFHNYLDEVWADPATAGISGFNELVLLNDSEYLGEIDTTGLLKLAQHGRQRDDSSSRAKIAIVYWETSNDTLATYLPVYKGARNLIPNSKREVQIFHEVGDAVDWLEN